MLNKLMKVVVLCVSLYSVQSHAALQTINWKTQGDGLASLDYATGLEWLDLTVTDGLSIDTVKSRLTTDYLGWRLPTITEIRSLLRATHNRDVGSDREYINSRSTSNENYANHALMGFTDNQTVAGAYQIYGSSVYVFSVDGWRSSQGTIYFNHYRGEDTSYVSQSVGVYLVSDGGVTISSISNPLLNINNPNAPVNNVQNVSEPLSALGVLAFILLAFRRRSLFGTGK